MGVQLNIKDERIVAAARQLAKDLGKSVTETIGEAIEEKRQRTIAQDEQRFKDVMSLLKKSAKMWLERTDGQTSRQLMDELYDENGLPK